MGFTLSKLMLMALIVAIVWYGFKYMQRVDAIRRALRDELQRRQGPARRPPAAVEDLVKCAACGAYVAAHGATHCGRPDCPWRRP